MFPALNPSWYPRLSIKSQVALVASLFTLILLSGIGYFLVQHFTQEMRQMVYQQQITVLQHVANELDEKIALATTDLNYLSRQVSQRKMDKTEIARLLEAQHGMYQQIFNGGVFVYDEKGTVIADYPAVYGRTGHSLAQRDFFKQLKQTQQRVIAEPQYAKHLATPVVIITLPITNQQGVMIGGISGAILLADSYLFNNIRQASIGRKGYFMVLSANLRMLVSPPTRHPFFVQLKPSDFGARISTALSHQPSGYATIVANRSPGLFSFVRSKNTQWIVSSFIPETEVLSPINHVVEHAVTVGALIMLASGLLLWLMMYALLRPFSKLYQAVVGLIKNDDKQLLERLSHSSHEAGQLSTAFLTLLRTIDDKTHGLQEKMNFIAALMNAIPALVFFKDKQGRYLGVNDQFYQLPFLSTHDVVGKTVFDIAPAEIAEEINQYEQELFSNGGGTHHQEIYFYDEKITKAYYGLIYRATFQDAHGDIAGCVGIILDITQQHEQAAALKAATETALAANQAKSVFLANMSHEIRTPMNGVLGMLDLVLETHLSQEQQEYLNLAKNSAAALLTLINDILDFSKIEAGKLRLERIEFPLASVVDECLKIVASRNHKIGLEIVPNFDDAIPDLLIGDPTRLRQVLLNLLGNALKFTEQGVIELQVSVLRRDSNRVVLYFAVCDTGVGIAEEKLETIFEAFNQADNTITRRFGGTGLGLSISNRLVQAMGGQLSVRSALQQGTTFFFELCFEYKLGMQPSTALPSEAYARPWLVLSPQVVICHYWAQALGHLGCLIHAVGDETQLQMVLAEELPLAYVLCDEQLLAKPDVQHSLEQKRPHWETIVLSRLGVGGVMPLPCLGRLLQPSLYQFVPEALHEVFSQTTVINEASHARNVAHLSLDILLAEDNSVNQVYARTLLEKMGHNVVVVEDGLAALQWIAQQPFDVVLMDVQMPKLDGLTATVRLREWEQQTQQVPHYVIAMTAYAMPEDEQRCLAAGMDAYLSKPVQATSLQTLLQARQRIKASQQPLAFDKTVLQQQWQADESLMRLVVAEVLQALPEQLQRLQASVAAGDVAAILHTAHTLKGSVANVAAQSAQQAALALEQAAKAASGNYAVLLLEVEQCVAQLLEALPALLE